MNLGDRTKALIAVGASITANCQQCLHSTVSMARETGADEQQIAEAIEVAKMVRRCAASNMEKIVANLNHAVPRAASPSNKECECQ